MSGALNVPAKRPRSCGSGGPLYDSLLPDIGTTAAPLADIVTLFNSKISQLTHDEEHKEYLACPYWKHSPARYILVKSSCTDGFGFKNIGKLMEHIKRVHCLWNGCERCRKRFNQAKKEEVDAVKRTHMIYCTQSPKELTELDAEWMNKDQDEAYGQLNFQKNKANPIQCYENICRALWGEEKMEINEPYHHPGFQMSVLRWEFIKDLPSLCGQKSIEAPRPDAKQEVAAAVLPPSTQHIDPAFLSTQTLDDVPSAPPPFYRAQRRNSDIYSWDPSEATIAEPIFPNFLYDDKPGGHNPEQPHNDLHYCTVGSWAGAAEPHEGLFGQFDQDADGEDTF
ncbi:uncharacterized protein F4812DRAFT_457082 [Daldinia caldariorum]|uniref:uncharacterized protein n=1 Tax=Daldinia caldariorum TaxID=326644 RepID=UPI0020081AFC|nr:uncharacterized protein F4812DRAFT_457082 [Daldinia caldariorum]KAI1469683.1 hypothetical protein F4812DRAFT_457082 [Daldinia caldariorum]